MIVFVKFKWLHLRDGSLRTRLLWLDVGTKMDGIDSEKWKFSTAR